MRPALGDAGRADRDRPEALEAAVEEAAGGPRYWSQREKEAGRQPEALLHGRERLHKRAAVPVADEAQQARAIGMSVHIGHTVEEAEKAFLRQRLDESKGRPAAQSMASRSRAPRGRNFRSASFRMSR